MDGGIKLVSEHGGIRVKVIRGGNLLFSLLAAVAALLGLLFCFSGKATAATYNIFDNATGGDCAAIANWNDATNTCTFTGSVNASDGIEISGIGITLDGAGNSLLGTGYGNGVYITGMSNVTVKNLSLYNFFRGIRAISVSDSVIADNFFDDTSNQGIIIENSENLEIFGNVMEDWTVPISAEGNYLDIDDNDINSGTSAVGISVNGSNNYVSNNNITAGYSGVYLGSSLYSLVENNLIQTSSSSATYGIIQLSDSSNNIVRRNSNSHSSSEDPAHGMYLQGGSHSNVIYGNDIDHATFGISLDSSHGNTFMGNTISYSASRGISLVNSNSNLFYCNNLLSNTQQIFVDSGIGNYFNLPIPTGGNFYSNRTAPDFDNDGFVDIPYVFYGGQDNLPWTAENGWCYRPEISWSLSNIYWNSYVDYVNGLLSVDYILSNAAGPDITDVTVINSVSTNGVALAEIPPPVDLIAGGSNMDVTLKYLIPPSVMAFQTLTYMSAQDLCGNEYMYPGPYPAL